MKERKKDGEREEDRWRKRDGEREMVKERKVDGERKTGRCHEWEG